MKKAIILIFVTSLLLSCDALIDNLDGSNSKNISNSNPVSFSNPEVGQSTIYVGLYIENYSNEHMSCSEYSDTLKIEVVDFNANAIELRQIFIYNNMILKSSDFNAYDTTYFTIELFNDSIKAIYPVPIIAQVIVAPNLFLWYNPSIPQETTNPATFTGGCLPKIPQQLKAEYLLSNLVIEDKTYSNISLFVNNTDMQVDGPGYTFIYSMKDGLIASYITNPWTDTGSGWKRIN